MPELLFPAEPGTQVHASTLLPLAGGGLLAAWFAGPHEGHPDTEIRVLRRTDSGTTIVAPWPEDPQPHWNPVLAHGPDGRVWLFFKRGARIDRWTTWVSVSRDDGRSWGEPAELVPGDRSGGRGPVRQAPVAAHGLWLAPGSVEQWDPPRWDCFVDVSDDAGHTWVSHPVPLNHDAVAGAGCIQPCLVPGRRNAWVMLTRSTAGAVLRSATDDPTVWPELTPSALPNNNSGIAAVALPDATLWCVHNDAAANWGARSRLVVSASADDGITWRTVSVLEDATGADGSPTSASATGVMTSGEGEYSYPAAVVVGDEVWITYSWQRASIALARLALPASGQG